MTWTSHRRLLLGPPLGLLVAVVVLAVVDLDLAVTGRFYDPATDSWPCVWRQPWHFLNLYGEFPGLLLGLGSLVVLLLGIGRPALHPHRKVCWFLLTALLAGPGLVVNAILKEHWGRPRPEAVEAFGGSEPYERLLRIDPASTGSSFPSGHASMGFLVLAVGLLLLAAGRVRSGRAVVLGSLVLGFVTGFSRVCSGKHFPSDVVSAGLVTWACTLAVFFVMGMHRSLRFAPAPPAPETFLLKAARLAAPVVVVLILAFAAVKWPILRRDTIPLTLPPAAAAAPLEIRFEAEGRLVLESGPQPQLTTIIDGHGLATARLPAETATADGTLRITNHREGLFWKIRPALHLTLPPDRSYRIVLGERARGYDIEAFEYPEGSPHAVEVAHDRP